MPEETLQYSKKYGQDGADYLFGFPSSKAPVISEGNFVARSAELRYEAEIFAQAQEGEGHTDCVVTSDGARRKITATFTGYIKADFDVADIQGFFQFPPDDGRWYITRNVSVPRRKGEFAEVTLEAESYGLVDTDLNPV